MKNLTITVEDSVLEWARIEAARRGTSVSRMVGDFMAELQQREDAYGRATRPGEPHERNSAGAGGCASQGTQRQPGKGRCPKAANRARHEPGVVVYLGADCRRRHGSAGFECRLPGLAGCAVAAPQRAHRQSRGAGGVLRSGRGCAPAHAARRCPRRHAPLPELDALEYAMLPRWKPPGPSRRGTTCLLAIAWPGPRPAQRLPGHVEPAPAPRHGVRRGARVCHPLHGTPQEFAEGKL